MNTLKVGAISLAILLGFSIPVVAANNYTPKQITDGLFAHLKQLPIPTDYSSTIAISWESSDISGQCFIVTKGGENIKLGLITIAIYDPKTMDSFNKFAGDYMRLVDKAADLLMDSTDSTALDKTDGILEMAYDGYKISPAPLASVKTDADGKFTLKRLPKGDFILFAYGSRNVGDKIEHYVWQLKAAQVRGQTQLFLSNDNMMGN
jgi:hypothetical protein